METQVILVVLLVSTAIGTTVGVAAGFWMINRKNRFKPTGDHLAALRNELAVGPHAASPTGANGVNLEDLRKLVVDRDDALRQSREDLEKAQHQAEQAKSESEQAKSETQQESIQRAAAEQRAQELAAQLAAQVATHSQQAGEWETRSQEHENLEARIASLTAELSAAKHSGQDEVDAMAKEHETLNARIASLTAELSAAKHSGQDEVDAMAKEHETLNARISSLTAELSGALHSSQENGTYRSSLESQLTADREYIGQLTAQIADLQREARNNETRFLEHRQTAAKGLELLTQAQDNFTNVLRTLNNHAETPVAAE